MMTLSSSFVIRYGDVTSKQLPSHRTATNCLLQDMKRYNSITEADQ